MSFYILTYLRFLVPLLDHLAQVNDEAVFIVEARPGQVHLICSDLPTTFDMQQALGADVIGHHMFKA